MATFLGLNGVRLEIDDADLERTIFAVAAGDMDEDTLTTKLKTWAIG